MIKQGKYDVVIAGSGLGGLLTGVFLSKTGYHVLVLEKNNQIGGCLQTFVRRGKVFDTGMHYVGSMEEGQALHKIFKYAGIIDDLRLNRLDMDCFDKIIYGGNEYNFAQGFDRFSDTMQSYFPDNKDDIKNYVAGIQELVGIIDLFNLRPFSSVSYINDPKALMSVEGQLKQITSNKMLQNVLSGMNGLYAGVPEATPYYVHALINNFFINSAWRLVNGGEQIADLLRNKIIENGGEVVAKKEIIEFVTKDNEIDHVLLSDSTKVFGKYFISNIHPAKTLSMIKGNSIRKAYRNRINNLENTIGMFVVYADLKEGTFPYLNHNVYYFNGDDVWGTRNYYEKEWPDGFMMYTPNREDQVKSAQNAIIITYMKYEELLKWENTWIENRGDDYREFKRNKAEKLIRQVDSVYPGFKNSVQHYYTSTPLSYRDYTGTHEGACYGIMKNNESFPSSVIHPRTRIKNLLFTGQNINIHGILGVSFGSIITCMSMPGNEDLISKINDVY